MSRARQDKLVVANHRGVRERFVASSLALLLRALVRCSKCSKLSITVVDGEVNFGREGRNNFTRAVREVETRVALRELGHDRERIKEVMAKTLTHVGTTDLSPGQWLAIALRYAQGSS